jgi:hypothetical protein
MVLIHNQNKESFSLHKRKLQQCVPNRRVNKMFYKAQAHTLPGCIYSSTRMGKTTMYAQVVRQHGHNVLICWSLIYIDNHWPKPKRNPCPWYTVQHYIFPREINNVTEKSNNKTSYMKTCWLFLRKSSGPPPAPPPTLRPPCCIV